MGVAKVVEARRLMVFEDAHSMWSVRWSRIFGQFEGGNKVYSVV